MTAPVPDLAERDRWFMATVSAAPTMPRWFLLMIAQVLATDGLRADALLSLADALDEAARFVDLDGDALLRSQLARLAELPRALAPKRAAVREEV